MVIPTGWGLTAAFVWGAIWGSFLNVAIYRIPRGVSLVRPGSNCPRCETPIRWYDNVPIIAWFLLRGRCRACGERFSIRYAAVELLAAVLALALFQVLVLTAPPDATVAARLAPWLVYFGFVAALIVVTFIDIDLQLVPTVITWPGAALGLVACILLGRIPWWESAAGLVLGWGVLYVINAGYRLLRGRDGLGAGDMSLLAMTGAFLGVRSLLFVFLAASLQGLLAAVVLGLIRKVSGVSVGLKTADGLDDEPQGADDAWRPMDAAPDDLPVHQAALAFVPFLSLAAVEWLLVGEPIVRWYFELVTGVPQP